MNKSTLIGVLLLLALLPGADAAAGEKTGTSPQQNSTETIRVSGIVTDETGTPLIGVTVLVDGTTQGTTTGPGGQYTIRCGPGDRLRLSYMGYEPLTLSVKDGKVAVAVMREDTRVIDDVVVIGYGTTTRKRNVGAVDQVKAAAFTERSMPTMTLALQGTSPGIVIQQRSFNPNDSDVNLNIRGIGTMNDNSPLIVIDGMVSDAASFNKLNPQDVENISVLKDAGSAAIYGSRSANGVLLITTKKGQKNQAPRVSFNIMAGIQSPKILFTPVAGYVNAALTNARNVNGGNAPRFTPEEIRTMKERGDSRYFLDEILQNAWQQNYNVSVQGGGKNSTYMVSAGYFNQRSNFVGPNYGIKRYNIRSNVTTEYKRFKLTTLLTYSREENKSPRASNLIADATRVPTYYFYKMYDRETGKYLVNDIVARANSLGLLEKGGSNQADNDYVNLNIGLDFKIAEGLKLRGVLGGNVFANHRHSRLLAVDFYDTPESDIARPANADRDTEDYNRKAWQTNTQLLLDFDRSFGKHGVTALLGVTNESFTAQENQVRLKFSDPDLGIKGDGTVVDPDGSYVSPEKTTKRSITSFLGRVNYNYDERYYLEASFRYDGSSKFRQDLRWGFFPSVSVGWRLSEEDFMTAYKEKVGDLKIRGSYGTLGNQSVNDYQYFTTYDVYAYNYAFNNQPVAGAGFQLGSEDLRWEVSRTFNIGVDATFFKGSLSVGFDYFRKNTSDILVTPQIPDAFGTKLQNYNAGEMRTQGWELTASYALRTGDFRHNFNFNIGDSWNKVLRFEGFEQIRTIGQISYLTREGLPLNSYYGLKTAGIFQSREEIANSALPTGLDVRPGDLKYVDRNNDGVIDADDRYYLGNAFPRYTFGFTYNIEWKGFDLSIFLQGALKRDMIIRGELVEPFHASYSHVIFEHQLDFWTPTNTGAKYPQLSNGTGSQANNWGAATGSDIYLFDGKYMRLKNLQLGYTLPTRFTTKFGVQKMKIYVNGQNLFTLSKNSFVDPETSEFGTNMNNTGSNSARNYPTLRYFGFGADITF